ncbi:tetratricopeptide repeat protein [Tumidithrix helvetica PCC 7403]|uniref:tetratricopeptide repeat protein n=1 Tax=Tumidithrix helvetica TaxID=3457545 RepID=UPI003CC2DA62
MAQRTARQWIINGVLIIVTLSFMGISIAPLLGGILTSAPSQQAKNDAQTTTEQEKIKIQIEGFEAVLKREPKNQTALVGLINLRNQLGDIKGTIEPLQTLADAYPDEPEYRLVLARTYINLNDRIAAAAEYRKILTTKPGNLIALDSLIAMEVQDNRPEAAIGLIQDTLKTADTANKIQPNTIDKPYVQWMLGEVYRRQNRFAEAIATFDQMIKEDSKNFRPVVSKAQVKRAQGKEDEAKALFAKAADLAPAQYKDEVNRIANAQTQLQPFTNDSKSDPKQSPATAPSTSGTTAPSSTPQKR